MELPSLWAHHAVVADFNHDGFLDVFVSNYQSEFTRSLDSHIYWGSRESNYTAANRQALHNESAAGVVAADLNGDGWVDLAVSNHVQNGDHHTNSLIFWNRSGRFNERDTHRAADYWAAHDDRHRPWQYLQPRHGRELPLAAP